MRYRAIVSSDWNECLAPCGPFDPISFTFPELEPDLSDIFAKYTGNEISLTQATQIISSIIPAPLTPDQMDAYLDSNFATYVGVADLIQWCRSHGILFMINTTGTQGYFQRVFARNLLPDVPLVAANPLVRFWGTNEDRHYLYQVVEIEDKPKNTESLMRFVGITPERVIIIGDSGGDGPHFEWGASIGAFLIGSMTKPSLDTYCRERGVTINKRFGHIYTSAESRDRAAESQANFMDLTESLSEALDL
jgi:2-hydroxy-3-keto-5-methylthiopentenyl-1-phosphate phosphatase